MKDRFPIFQHNPDLVFLDTAASAQKPDAVLGAVDRFYRTTYANIHRGMYGLSIQATEHYDAARKRVAGFIGAPDPDSVVFTRNATEGINLVAYTFGDRHVGPGDEIVVTLLEHHANFVPWQRLAEKTGARFIPVGIHPDTLELDMEAMAKALSHRTRIVACTLASNVLGTTPDVARVVRLAREVGAVTVVDAAQYVPHHPLNIAAIDPDFLVFSGHKMMALDGIGVLYGRPALLRDLPPFLSGGDMIERVTVDRTTYADPPQRFEAGTPFIAGAVSLAAAIDFIETIGIDAILAHETRLARLAQEKLAALGGVRLYRPKDRIHNGILPFNVDGVHPHDTATILAEHSVCIRAGHHCAAPLIDSLNEMALARASFYIYNDETDVDRLVTAIRHVKEIFGK